MKYAIELELSKSEAKKIRERYQALTEMSDDDFRGTTTEEAIQDLFYFDELITRTSKPYQLDLRSNVKIKKVK